MPISTFFGETLRFGINRIIGSFIGAIVGILIANIQSQNALLAGLGVIIIIYTCNYLKWNSTTSIACLVFTSIIVGVKGPSAVEYSFHRLLDTFIGIVITTIVNNYVFNPDMAQLLKEQAENIKKQLLHIANNNFSLGKDELKKIELEITALKEKLRIYTEELKLNSKSSTIKIKLTDMYSTLTITFDEIKTINYINADRNKNEIYNTSTDLNIITATIELHKKIFFNEIENLNRILSDITPKK